MMTRPITLLALLLPLASACELQETKLTAGIETTNGSTATTDDPPGTGSTSGSATGATDGTTSSTTDPTGEPLPPTDAIDILFVIDNSGSMAMKQQRMVEGLPAMISALGDADLRIAITTTDSGNPRCPSADTTPEGGKFVMRNCGEAITLGEFAIEQTGDDYSSSCTDVCQTAGEPGPVVTVETVTAEDPEPKLRRWIERSDGVLNTSADLAQSLACALPQGVSGCGFESPLESMYLALAQSLTVESATNYGFLRPEADLVVVFLTDELDCSYNPEFSEIFTSNKTFWEDPNGPASTSAVCFNAGAACVGGPGTYDSCNATNYDITGAVTSDLSMAVLQPVSKYVDFLQTIQAGKTGGATVRVVGIAGVPIGFETGEVPLVYADSTDQQFQDDFGIAPGCSVPDPMIPGKEIYGIPPFRILNFAQPFGDMQFFSICEDNFDSAMAAVGTH